MAYIKTGRDPFARQDVRRRQVEGECDWCGGHNAKGKVFVYIVEPDGLLTRTHEIPGVFCCIACLNSYHN